MSTWHTWTGVRRSSGQQCGGQQCGGRLSGGWQCDGWLCGGWLSGGWQCGGWQCGGWQCDGWLCGGWLSGGWLCGGWLSGGSWFVQLVGEASCTGYPMILQHLYIYTYMQNKHALHNAYFCYKTECINLCKIYAYGISVVHLDIHTCIERSCTLKPLNGFIAVSPLCSPSLECSP